MRKIQFSRYVEKFDALLGDKTFLKCMQKSGSSEKKAESLCAETGRHEH